MNLDETKLYGIDKEEDWRGAFYVQDSELLERNGYFKTDKGSRIDIYIKEACGDEPHIHLRDNQGNICRIKLRKSEYQRDNYEKGKNRHKLTKDELIAFNKYMHEKVPNMQIINWEYLSAAWNTSWTFANEGKTSGLVDISIGCPDYLNIKEPK